MEYKVKKGFENACISITKPFKGINRIVLKDATQAQLEYLYLINYPGVEKIKTVKNETKKRISKQKD